MLRRIAREFGSLRCAILLLAAIAAASMAATFYEAGYGTAPARAAFYGAWWFLGLLGLLCVNLSVSAARRWPFRWRHSGFLLTHVSIVLILLGAMLKLRFGVEGRLALREGETRKRFVVERRLPDGRYQEVPLGFALTLRAFRVVHHQGSSRPADFQSHLLVSGVGDRIVSMNRPITVGRYTLYQTGYSRGVRDTSILTVSYDPGKTLVYVGFVTLLVGMFCTFYVKPLARGSRTQRDGVGA